MEKKIATENNSPKMKLKTKWLIFSIGSLILIVIGFIAFSQSIISQTQGNANFRAFYAGSLLLIIGGFVAFGHSIILRSDLNRKKHYANKKPYFNKRNNPKKNKP